MSHHLLEENSLAINNRNFGIDLIRGLSILLVVIHHLAMSFRLPLAPSYLGEILSKRIINGISFNGYEAVFIFFVLSGFLIAQGTLQSYGELSKMNWRRFYIKRFSRIFPLLAALLILLSILHGMGFADYVVQKQGQTLWRALLSALGLHLNWYESQTTWLPAAWDVLWSLSIEEVFYLAFPILCILLPRYLLVILLLALAFSLPWTRAALDGNEIWQEKAYLPGMSAIAFGVLTALCAHRWKASMNLARSLIVIGVVGLVSVFFFGHFLWGIVLHHIMLILCLSACFLVFALNRLQLKPIIGLGWLALMGRLSYEIYLSHMFIVLSVCNAYRYLMGENMLWSFSVYIPTIMMCILLGINLEKRISLPALVWLRKRQ